MLQIILSEYNHTNFESTDADHDLPYISNLSKGKHPAQYHAAIGFVIVPMYLHIYSPCSSPGRH